MAGDPYQELPRAKRRRLIFRAGVSQTAEMFSQLARVPRAQVRDSKPSLQPLAENSARRGR
jgi:hypothetical protein